MDEVDDLDVVGPSKVVDNSEFRKWRTIERFSGVHMIITEKLHGSNAQVNCIRQPDGTLKAIAGKRTSYIGSDGHFGFGEFVTQNNQAICDALGEGRHYGEWVGPGINGQYGLKDKVFVLFNHRYHLPKKLVGVLPPRIDVVPVLYDGHYSIEAIETAMETLKVNGSVFAPGFMKSEGIVIEFPEFGTTKKKVFKPEETGWDKSIRVRDPNVPKYDPTQAEALAAPYLQSVRLEKLLMKEESYLRDFPKSLPAIVRAYLEDLFTETGAIDDNTTKAIKKLAFPWALDLVPSLKQQLVP